MAVLGTIFVSDIFPVFLIAGIGFLLSRWLQVQVRSLQGLGQYEASLQPVGGGASMPARTRRRHPLTSRGSRLADGIENAPSA